jgi:nucleoside-diphosphate-sugar epimerase
MRDSGNRIVLTGGAGFIGSHLAEALIRRGSKLTIIDNIDNFYSGVWKKANLENIRRIGSLRIPSIRHLRLGRCSSSLGRR